MNFNKLLTRISLIFLLTASLYLISYSCGWTEDECDSYVSFVNPNITDVKNASHFYYTPSMMFYDCEIDTSNYTNKPTDSNNEEWKQYTGEQVETNDIDFFINNSSLDTLRQFYDLIEKNKTAEFSNSFLQNSFTKWFKQSKDLEALGYILYAKQCEKLSSADNSEWQVPTSDSVLANKLIKNGKQLYAASKKKFIKERYAFQLIKSAFYGGKYKDVLTYTNDYYEPVKGEIGSIDERIVGYRAGALFRSHNEVESAYLFSKLFDESNQYDMAYSNSLGFVWSYNETRLNKILALCKNNHEKATVYALTAMRNDKSFSMESLQSVYKEEPFNKYLDIILLREINKIEHDYMDEKFQFERGYYIYDAWMGNSSMVASEEQAKEWFDTESKTKASLEKLTSYVEGVIAERNVKTISLWLSAAAYLHMIQQDYATCEKLLNEATQQNPTSKVASQIRMLKLINTIQKQTVLNAEIESQLAGELTWFENYANQNHIYQKNFRNLLKTVLPIKYQSSKDSIKMMLCYHRYENAPNYAWWQEEQTEENKVEHFSEMYYQNSGYLMDHYFTQKQLDELIAYKDKSKSSFDQWLLKENNYSTSIINELKAVKYFRTFDYVNARQAIASNQNQPNVPNLFVAHIRDYQYGYEEDTLQTYTMSQVLDTMISFKKKSFVDLKSAFDYACALYSLSYHGKCHSAWTFNRSSSEIDPYFYSPISTPTAFEKQYFYVEEATDLFDRVYKESSNEEMKQKALWMLAKCKQKKCGNKRPEYLGWYGNDDDESKSYVSWNVNNNNYLALFHQTYQKTPFYDEVYQECSYLRLFAKKN